MIPSVSRISIYSSDSFDLLHTIPNTTSSGLVRTAVDPISCQYYFAEDGRNSNPSFIHVFDDEGFIKSLSLPNGWIGDVLVTSSGQLITSTSSGIGFYDNNSDEWTWHKDPLYDPILDRHNGV